MLVVPTHNPRSASRGTATLPCTRHSGAACDAHGPTVHPPAAPRPRNRPGTASLPPPGCPALRPHFQPRLPKHVHTQADLWPYSSPCTSIGTPWDSSSAAMWFRTWRARRLATQGLLVGPSSPQFQLRLCDSPSLSSNGALGGCGGAAGEGGELPGRQAAKHGKPPAFSAPPFPPWHCPCLPPLSSPVCVRFPFSPPPLNSKNIRLPAARACCPRRWPRCASRCTTPGRPAKSRRAR